jgi:SAM-dependent methyltransferase
MSLDDQIRWDRQHTQRQGGEEPADFLRQIFETEAWPLPRERALDLACGKGRHSLYLAERGFEVIAMDISPVALAEGRRRADEKRLSVQWRQADLEQVQLEEAGFDLIVNFNYLQRSLFEQIKRALRTGGHIVFETYLIDQREMGHPKNPEYLLGYNELLERFRDFRVLCYREGSFADGGEISFRAGIFAQKRA